MAKYWSDRPRLMRVTGPALPRVRLASGENPTTPVSKLIRVSGSALPVVELKSLSEEALRDLLREMLEKQAVMPAHQEVGQFIDIVLDCSCRRERELVQAEPPLSDPAGVGKEFPLKGAKSLWGGQHSPNELDCLAAKLCESSGVSPVVLEDALSEWGKRKDPV